MTAEVDGQEEIAKLQELVRRERAARLKAELLLDEKNQELSDEREALAQCRTQWLEAQQRRKAVELLLEKQAGRAQLKAQRQEQKMLDDYAILRRYHHSGL